MSSQLVNQIPSGKDPCLASNPDENAVKSSVPEMVWSHVRFMLNRNHMRIQGVGNTVCFRGAGLKNVRIAIDGDENEIWIEPGANICNLTIDIKGSRSRLVVGKDVFIGGGYWSIEDGCSALLIGQGTSMLGTHLVVSETGSQIVIGEDCLMSFDIDMRTGDSHSVVDVLTQQRLNRAQDVTIGSHVWVSAHVQILKGVTIGAGSIIGAGAVVTSDVPAGSMAVGVPARTVRTNVTWLREKV